MRAIVIEFNEEKRAWVVQGKDNDQIFYLTKDRWNPERDPKIGEEIDITVHDGNIIEADSKEKISISPQQKTDDAGNSDASDSGTRESGVLDEYIAFPILSGGVSGVISYFVFQNFGIQGAILAWIGCYVIFINPLKEGARLIAVFITIALTLRSNEMLEFAKNLKN